MLAAYDSVGAKGLPESFVQELVDGGVPVKSFVTNRQMGRRFQVNFRNHRKLVVVDGHTAFIGGLNAGDEYMGLGSRGLARHTHADRGAGGAIPPGVVCRRLALCLRGEVPKVPIRPRVVGDERVLPFASGRRRCGISRPPSLRKLSTTCASGSGSPARTLCPIRRCAPRWPTPRCVAWMCASSCRRASIYAALAVIVYLLSHDAGGRSAHLALSAGLYAPEGDARG